MLTKKKKKKYPITTESFQKNGYDCNAFNNVRDSLYNTDIITSIVKLIIHSPVGNLLIYRFWCVCVFLLLLFGGRGVGRRGGGGGGGGDGGGCLISPLCEKTSNKTLTD